MLQAAAFKGGLKSCKQQCLRGGDAASGGIVAVVEELKVTAAEVLQAAAFKGDGDSASGSI